MSSNSFFAKFGVLLLVLLNVGAYYFFWPKRESAVVPALEQTRSETSTRLEYLPGASAKATLATKPMTEAVKITQAGEEQETDETKRARPTDTKPADLLPSIPSPIEVLPPAVLATSAPMDLPSAPPPTGGIVKKDEDPTLALLKRAAENVDLVARSEPEKPAALDVKTAAALVSKADSNSPWTLQMEISGGQTILIARLHKNQEFKIVCDRIEMKTPDGAVVAVGKVTVLGSGLKGACQKLTLPLNEDRLLLEGKAEVHIQQRMLADLKGEFYRTVDGPAAELRGELLSLRLPVLSTGAPAAAVVPAAPLIPSGTGLELKPRVP